MTTFPSTIKFQDVNVDTSNTVVSDITSLSGKREVVLGEQHNMVVDLKTFPLTELEDKGFQAFINEIRNYGLIDLPLDQLTVFKPISTSSTKMSVAIGNYPIGSKTIFVEESGVNLKIAVGSWIQFQDRSGVQLSKLYQIIKIEQGVINIQNNNTAQTRLTLNTGLVSPLVSYSGNNYVYDVTAQVTTYTYTLNGTTSYSFITGNGYINYSNYNFATSGLLSLDQNIGYKITNIDDSVTVSGTPNIQALTLTGNRSNIRRPGSNEYLDIFLSENANSGANITPSYESQKLAYLPGIANTSSSVNTDIKLFAGVGKVLNTPTVGSTSLVIEPDVNESDIFSSGELLSVSNDEYMANYKTAISSTTMAYYVVMYKSGTDIRIGLQPSSAVFSSGTVASTYLPDLKEGVTYTIKYYNGSSIINHSFVAPPAANITMSTIYSSPYAMYVPTYVFSQSYFTTSTASFPTSATTAYYFDVSSNLNQTFKLELNNRLSYSSYNSSTNTFTLNSPLTQNNIYNLSSGTNIKTRIYSNSFNNSASSSTVTSDIVNSITTNTSFNVTDNTSSTDINGNYLYFTKKQYSVSSSPISAYINNNGETNNYVPTLKIKTTGLTINLNSTTSYNLDSLTFERISSTTFNASGLNNTSLNQFNNINTSARFASLADTNNIYRDTSGYGIYMYMVNLNVLSGGGGGTSYALHIKIDPNTSGYDATNATQWTFNTISSSNSNNSISFSFHEQIFGIQNTVNPASTQYMTPTWRKIGYSSTTALNVISNSSINFNFGTNITGNGGTFRFLNNPDNSIYINYPTTTTIDTSITQFLAFNQYGSYYPGANSSSNAYIIINEDSNSNLTTMYKRSGSTTYLTDLQALKSVWDVRPSGEEWYYVPATFDSLNSSQSSNVHGLRDIESCRITSINPVNHRIYLNGQYANRYNSITLNNVYYSNIKIKTYSCEYNPLANGNYFSNVATIKQGSLASGNLSFTFDPDTANTIYTGQLTNYSISANSNYSSILNQIGNAIVNLNSNFTWNNVVTSGTAASTIQASYQVFGTTYNMAINGNTTSQPYINVARSPYSTLSESDVAALNNKYPIGTQFSIGGSIFTTSGGFYPINSGFQPYCRVPGNTFTSTSGTNILEVVPATSKISINLGTDVNINPSFSMLIQTGATPYYNLISTDGVSGTGTSSTYNIKDPQGNIVRTFTSFSQPTLATDANDVLLNLSSNYSVYYDTGTSKTIVQSVGANATLLTNLQSKLNDGGVYYIGGLTSNTAPSYGNRITGVTYTTTPTNRLLLDTYVVPTGLPTTSGTAEYNHYIYYEASYNSDYVDVLNAFKLAIDTNTEIPINYNSTINYANKTLTLTSAQPEIVTSNLWSVTKNNNGVTGSLVGNIQFGTTTDGVYTNLTNVQIGTRIVTPPAKKVTLENLDDLATLPGYSMAKTINNTDLLVTDINIPTKVLTFDSTSPNSPTSLGWSVGDLIYRSRGLSPIRYVVTSIIGNNIYLDSDAGLNIGDYITADLNSASSVNTSKIYKIAAVNVELNYITLEVGVIPSTISSIINSSTSSIRKVIGGTVSASGTGYDIVSVNSGASKVYLQTMYNIKVGSKLTSDNTAYYSYKTATVTAVNDDNSVTLNSIPATFLANAEVYLVSEYFTGYRIVSIANNVLTLNNSEDITVGERISISNTNTSQGYEVLNVNYDNETVTLDATPLELLNGGYVANAEVFVGSNATVNNLTVTGIDRLENKVRLNYVNNLSVGDSIVGNDLKTVTITTSGHSYATQFNGSYTQVYHVDYLSFVFRTTIYDPENTVYGPVPGSAIYKKDDAEIYLWNRYDPTSTQGGWHIGFRDPKNPNVSWMYFRQLNSTTPQTNTLGSNGTWYVVNPGLYASQLTANNVSAVNTSVTLGTIEPMGTLITNITGNILKVDNADIIGDNDVIRKGRSVSAKSKVYHKDLIGKFRLIDGEFNSTSSYLLADGTQMKTYRFKLVEEL
jgi:hypothetical protein